MHESRETREEMRAADGGVRWVAAAAVLVSIGVVAGCQSDDSSLSGSVGRIYDLSFQNTRARLYDSEFSIEYVREDGQIPVRVVVDRDGESELSTGSIDLEKRGAVLGRVDNRRLPEFESGSLQLEAFEAKQGAKSEGSFDAQLRSQDSTFTLKGKFSTRLEIVDGSIGYTVPDTGGGPDANLEVGTDAGGGGDR